MSEIKKLVPIGVKITRAERRNRKIILVIEPDLFSNEVFAETPFYDEGPEKTQLQSVNFSLSVKEERYKISASVFYQGAHYTKGCSQIHDINRRFIDKKDCALNWVQSETEEYLTEERLGKVLKMWETEPNFQQVINDLFKKRKAQIAHQRLAEVKAAYHIALEKYEAELEKVFK